jgi:hypothetical protein
MRWPALGSPSRRAVGAKLLVVGSSPVAGIQVNMRGRTSDACLRTAFSWRSLALAWSCPRSWLETSLSQSIFRYRSQHNDYGTHAPRISGHLSMTNDVRYRFLLCVPRCRNHLHYRHEHHHPRRRRSPDSFPTKTQNLAATGHHQRHRSGLHQHGRLRHQPRRIHRDLRQPGRCHRTDRHRHRHHPWRHQRTGLHLPATTRRLTKAVSHRCSIDRPASQRRR